MSQPTTAEVFGRCMELLMAKDVPGFIEMLAPDCVMEFPFTPPPNPRRVEGVDALREYFVDYAKTLDVKSIDDVVMHQTTDPETIIVEFRGDALAVNTGKPVEIAFVSVFTARDGLVVRYRDYWNPLTTMALQATE